MKTNLSRRRHRVQHTEHDLSGTRATRLVARLSLDQLGVRENDPELIVQAVEQQAEILGHEAVLHAIPAARAGSRQSVSTKIRIEPPAVRTYSTLPPAIQL